MTRAVRELAQIPFSQLIGGPLKAAVEAQALAAQSSIEFIEKIGFKEPAPNDPMDILFQDASKDADAGELRSVSFSYEKKDENEEVKKFSLTVPFLSIVNIPSLRIDEMTIDFEAKLTDAIQRSTKSNFKLDSSLKGGYSSFFSPVKLEFRVSASYQRETASTMNQQREYNMRIHVRATQDRIPAGLDRMLNILETAIREQPKSTTTP